MNKVTINGKIFESRGSINITTKGASIMVNGEPIDGEFRGIVEIKVEGAIGVLKTDAAVVCQDVHGYIAAGGSVEAKTINGDVAAGGSLTCNDVTGNADARGSITCGKVGGSIKAGGSISHG